MKKPKQFVRINTLMTQVDRLRTRRDGLQSALTETDAKLADLEVEWADLQKDISNAIFGRGSLDEVALSVSKKKRGKKKVARVPRKTHAAKKSSAKKRKVMGTRGEIQAAAKKRDAKLIFVLKKSHTPRSILELHNAVKNGTLSQMQTSLKRMRKLVKRTGTGRAARYTLKGK